MAKTFAIADLHGRDDLLRGALAAIHEYGDRQPGTIVTMGDYIDRGPESRQIIERLMAGLDGGWKLVCLRGNHEDIMLASLRAPGLINQWWVPNGGGQTLASYGVSEGTQHL